MTSGHFGIDRHVGISRHDEQPTDRGGLSTGSGGTVWLLCLGVFQHPETCTERHSSGGLSSRQCICQANPKVWGNLKPEILPLLLGRSLASLGLAAKPQSGNSGMKTAATTLYLFLFNVSFPLDYKLHEDKDIFYLLHCLSPVPKASLEQPRH